MEKSMSRIKKPTRLFLRSALFLTATATPAWATVRSYVGPDGGNWNNAANWSPFGVPVVGDNPYFQTNADKTLNYDGSYTIPGVASLLVEGINFATGTMNQSVNTLYINGQEQIAFG